MKSLPVLLHIALTVLIAPSLRANIDDISSYQLKYPLLYESDFEIDSNWILKHYYLNRVGGYVDEYYGTYYRDWERYLSGKQRELAGKFGLSNIFFKPNFKSYEETKVAFVKNIWSDKVHLRYSAPVGDIRDFRLSVSLRPLHFMEFFAGGHMNGERSIALVVNKPLGRANQGKDLAWRTRRLLGKAKRLVKLK